MGGLQAVTKFFDEVRVLEHEFERKAWRKIVFQNVQAIAHDQR